MQIYDLPYGFIAEEVVKEISNCIGTYLEADPKCFDGDWKGCVRTRITMDIRRLLKRRMKIMKPGSAWHWANIKFERLPTFCYFCGLTGHSEKFCEKLFDSPSKPTEMSYGACLRAPTRANVPNIGERWL